MGLNVISSGVFYFLWVVFCLKVLSLYKKFVLCLYYVGVKMLNILVKFLVFYNFFKKLGFG